MKDLLIAYKKELIQGASFLYVPFCMFLISLAMVYLFGRMLGLVKTNTSKNVVAFISMVGSYVFYFFYYQKNPNLMQSVWHILIYFSISVLFYVLIGFKLYDRVDGLLDKISVDKTLPKDKKKH